MTLAGSLVACHQAGCIVCSKNGGLGVLLIVAVLIHITVVGVHR